MHEKQYMVVVLPRGGNFHTMEQKEMLADYDEAFQLLNSYVSEYTEQVFKRPRREKPIRIALAHAFVELWIITRTEEVTTD